jgi:predicted DNA-binding protein (MmcQ/YjbR family)
MDLETVRDYCLNKVGTSESFPFDEETLVFKVMGKIYAIIPLERIPHQINLKCEPELAIDLRDRHPDSVFPGYHMNKKHWNTVFIESELSVKQLIIMIDHSYDLITSKLNKALKLELETLRNDNS